MTALGRRNFLLALTGFSAGLLVQASASGLALGHDSTPLLAWLRGGGAGWFADLPALRRLGALYLNTNPEEASGARLSRLMLTGSDGAVALRLRSAISRDWSNHRVVAVDGWLMARTEARLCAFLHLERDALR